MRFSWFKRIYPSEGFEQFGDSFFAKGFICDLLLR
jgi:hypothetical protein